MSRASSTHGEAVAGTSDAIHSSLCALADQLFDTLAFVKSNGRQCISHQIELRLRVILERF